MGHGPGEKEDSFAALFEQGAQAMPRRKGYRGGERVEVNTARLEALIAAARRGARVRILLDSFFDEPAALRSNAAPLAYVRAVAAQERLNLQAQLGNPTAGGIHAKLLLARIGGETWSAVGSLNGGEVSFKLNREVVLLLDSPAIFARLHAVFDHDWAISCP